MTATAAEAPPPRLAAALAAATARLAAAGIDSPGSDARILAQHALGLDRAGLLAARDRPLTRDEAARYAALIGRRAAREPVSRIVGHREFWSLDLLLSPATLDPRPDSETAVEAALAVLPDRGGPLRLLDLGTGTGCLLLALLGELPAAWGIGVDRSAEAAATARRNAERLGLAGRAAFLVGEWGTALAGGFDLVIANPPYVAVPELAGLAPEVARFDPLPALAGGADGLDAYRRLAPELPRLLRPGGHAVLEVGAGQAPAAAGLLTAAGLHGLRTRRDLAGTERCVTAKK